VFYCITGFGSYSYYGPMGIGDTRTHEARGARTVDFDVTKNETPAAPEAPTAPTIHFSEDIFKAAMEKVEEPAAKARNRWAPCQDEGCGAARTEDCG
jgi:hypothetical protein